MMANPTAIPSLLLADLEAFLVGHLETCGDPHCAEYTLHERVVQAMLDMGRPAAVASRSCIVCPQGHTDAFWYDEDVIRSRIARLRAGVLTIETDDEDDSDGDNGRLRCRTCNTSFPVPEDVEIEFD